MASYKSLLRNFASLDHSQNEMKIKEKILAITDSYSFYFLWMNAIPDKRVSRKVDKSASWGPKCSHTSPFHPHFQVKTLEKKIGEVTWVSVLVHEINWKQGIPLLDFSGLIKTHKTQMTKTAPIDLQNKQQKSQFCISVLRGPGLEDVTLCRTDMRRPFLRLSGSVNLYSAFCLKCLPSILVTPFAYRFWSHSLSSEWS